MTALEWYAFARNELSLFAAVFFLIGAIDELAIDCAYFWLRVVRRVKTPCVEESQLGQPIGQRCAILIPAWREAAVIGATVSHALAAYPHEQLWILIGVYHNDPETLAAVRMAAREDARLHVVVVPHDGPTCKADCLNHLFAALCKREEQSGERTGFVILHDAEDMVDPAALPLLDREMAACDFVQLPVLALPQRNSIWIAGHYSDEFAEAHAKTMVVRDALGAPIPGAGVGCAISRGMLDKLAERRGGQGPFAVGALTEDYELGLTIGRLGGSGKFLRCRTTTGRLIATRAYFPAALNAAIRQKARWIHGIALQGWDRLGWAGGATGVWMQLRDRRGPFAALLLATAYALLVLTTVEFALSAAGIVPFAPLTPALVVLLIVNTLVLIWRAILRALFTAREHGLAEGVLAIPRIVISNAIAILAGRRAFMSYLRSLLGAPFAWDKTEHNHHPTLPVGNGR